MPFKPTKIKFDLCEDEELIQLCALEIISSATIDSMGYPIPDGLYDERMGPVHHGGTCKSCKLNYFSCPGHFGYIKTDEYVKPVMLDIVLYMLQSKCLFCKRYKFVDEAIEVSSKEFNKNLSNSDSESTEEEFDKNLTNNDKEETNFSTTSINFDLINALNTEEIKKLKSKCINKRCPHCLTKSQKLSKVKSEIHIKEEKMPISNIKTILGPHFKKCFSSILLVPPNKFRPLNFLNNKVFEDEINTFYRKIIKEKDNSLIGQLVSEIKQLFEKKDGLFRQNILGKRVNYSARSVISPDCNIGTGEIGLPLIFAKKFSFPERVTEFNFDRLYSSVINGNKYPGANFISNDNSKIDLSFLDDIKRKALANQLKIGNKTVHRHVLNDDWLLVNRQPSLHKPSIMAHKVKVLGGEKTIRLHYANCNSYNADFDGDEMNLHLVQDYLSLSEAKEIMSTDQNYKSDTNNKPIRGLVQDHIVGASILTMKDTFFTKEEYFFIIDKRMNNTIGPTILRPVIYYTGKQCITHLLKSCNINISLVTNTKLDSLHKEESNLVIYNSVMMTGILDKNNLGPTPNSLIDLINKNSNEVLTSFSLLVNRYLIKYGFTLSIEDLFLNKDAEEYRSNIINNSNNINNSDINNSDSGCNNINNSDMIGNINNKIDNNTYGNNNNNNNINNINNISNNISSNEIDNNISNNNIISNNISNNNINNVRNNNNIYVINNNIINYENDSSVIKPITNKITSDILNKSMDNFLIPFPYNNLLLIVLTGAKGSLVNVTQISCLLGQQELEGKRVPLMNNNKTLCILPSYTTTNISNNNKLISGGFIFDRFLSGIKMHSYYFHCMAGREGLIDTAVKTARSGYLQRCLIKHLEGLTVSYTGLVMNNNKIVSYNSNKEGGTPVGLIAAQSIGEPSTQMTLNTFHLAGVGSKNVTLGIPRLREVLLLNNTNKKYASFRSNEYKKDVFMLKEVIKEVIIKEGINKDDYNYKCINIELILLYDINNINDIIKDKFIPLINKKLKKYFINEKVNVTFHNKSTFSFILKNNRNILLYNYILEILEEIKIKESEIKNINKENNIITLEGCDLGYLIKYLKESYIIKTNNHKRIKSTYNTLFTKTYSNDINSIYDVLGIEASIQVIIKKLRAVFDSYGISLDMYHLSLISDYMCRSGRIKAFNRNSFLSEDCPIQRMSFEGTYTVLKNSLNKDIHINGPSSKQLIGGIIREECEIIYDFN